VPRNSSEISRYVEDYSASQKVSPFSASIVGTTKGVEAWH